MIIHCLSISLYSTWMACLEINLVHYTGQYRKVNVEPPRMHRRSTVGDIMHLPNECCGTKWIRKNIISFDNNLTLACCQYPISWTAWHLHYREQWLKWSSFPLQKKTRKSNCEDHNWCRLWNGYLVTSVSLGWTANIKNIFYKSATRTQRRDKRNTEKERKEKKKEIKICATQQ